MLHLVEKSGDDLQILNPIEPLGLEWSNLLYHQRLLRACASSSSCSAIESGATIVNQSVAPLLPVTGVAL